MQYFYKILQNITERNLKYFNIYSWIGKIKSVKISKFPKSIYKLKKSILTWISTEIENVYKNLCEKTKGQE